MSVATIATYWLPAIDIGVEISVRTVDAAIHHGHSDALPCETGRPGSGRLDNHHVPLSIVKVSLPGSLDLGLNCPSPG